MPEYAKMDPEFKQKWVEALRSGTYLQGKGYLCVERIDDKLAEQKYCCLGVAAELAQIPKRRETPDPSYGSAYFYDFSDRLADQDMSQHVPDGWQGLSDRAINTLIDKNDDKNWSFKRIATWIEKYL